MFPVDPAKAVHDALVLLVLRDVLVGVLDLQQDLHSNAISNNIFIDKYCTRKVKKNNNKNNVNAVSANSCQTIKLKLLRVQVPPYQI